MKKKLSLVMALCMVIGMLCVFQGNAFAIPSTMVSSGKGHTISIDPGGMVFTWGTNGSGQLGNGTNVDSLVPVPVPLPGRVIAVAAGSAHSLALLDNGQVWSWGENGSGQLGDGSFVSRNIPAPVIGLPAGAIAIAAGEQHSMALLPGGRVYTWGGNSNGQLGDGTNMTRPVPAPVVGLPPVDAIACGNFHSMARIAGPGNLFSWGCNAYGQLGDGTNVDKWLPVPVVGLPNPIKGFDGGFGHSIAYDSKNRAWTWGWNQDGQLGNGNNINSPVPVPVAAGPVFGVAAGFFHSMIVTTSNYSVFTFGNNNAGQLGNGTFFSSNLPVPALGMNGVTGISGGGYHSQAVMGAWAWSWGMGPALGYGNTMNSPLPVPTL